MNRLFFSLAFLLLFVGCKKTEAILVGKIMVTPVINPAVSVLIKENAVIYAMLDTGNTIRGITRNNAFVTSNNFDEFTISSYNAISNLKYHFDGIKTMAYSYKDYAGQVIGYVNPYTLQWQTATLVFPPTHMYEELNSIRFINRDELVMMDTRYDYYPYDSFGWKTSVQKYNTKTGVAAQLAIFDDGYAPRSMELIDEQRGFIL